MRPRPFTCLGAPTLGCFRFPDLEDAAEAHEHHVLGQSGIG